MVLKDQQRLRELICDNLYAASKSLADASHVMSHLEGDQNFLGLAKAMADNLATMASNLENHIKYIK